MTTTTRLSVLQQSHATAYLDPIVDEASAVASGPQMGVFFSAGHLDVPHRFPRLIELAVNRVNSRVVGSHCVAQVGGDAVFLQHKGKAGGGQCLSEPHPPKPWTIISPATLLFAVTLLSFNFKFNVVLDLKSFTG